MDFNSFISFITTVVLGIRDINVFLKRKSEVILYTFFAKTIRKTRTVVLHKVRPCSFISEPNAGLKGYSFHATVEHFTRVAIFLHAYPPKVSKK